MPEDYYSDNPGPADETEESPEEGRQETTLIPKSMCPGMEVGDSLEFRIVRSHDKEYEVEYTGRQEEEPEETETPAPGEMMAEAGPPAGAGMAGMMG